MKPLLIAAATAMLMAGVADAQFKTPAQTQTGPGTIKITPGAPGASVSTAEVSDDLSKARRISRADAMKMVKLKKAVYVDVRSKETFDQGHLPGAINIPLSELQTRFKDLPGGKFLITYCAWQAEHTSARAVLDLNAHGIKNAAALLDGWTGWKDAGLPIVTTKGTAAKK